MGYKYLESTKNFNIDDFKCNHCGQILDTEPAAFHIKRLQRFRDWYNRPMHVTNGYRCKVHNAAVGGAKSSKHLEGIATDISWPDDYKRATPQRKKEFEGNLKKKWYELCKQDGAGGGICFYDWGFHLDSRLGTPIFEEFRK